VSQSTQRGLQLIRLTHIIDVVFALVIWRIFQLLPKPGDNPAWESVADMLADQWPSFGVMLLAVLIVIIYWQQHNAITRYLVATDSKHTTLSIFQVLFLLLFLYSIGAGMALGASPSQRAFESAATLMVGLFSNLSWRYAIHGRRLLDPDIDQEKVEDVSRKIMAEPVTAAITVPFAYIGPWMWEVSWFLYPLIRRLFSRLRRHVEK